MLDVNRIDKGHQGSPGVTRVTKIYVLQHNPPDRKIVKPNVSTMRKIRIIGYIMIMS